MSLKYSCKIKCFLFWQVLFWNSFCRPWNSTFVWFHTLTLTMNSNPNNCPKLWPVNLYARERAEMQHPEVECSTVSVLGQVQTCSEWEPCDPEVRHITLYAAGLSKPHLSLSLIPSFNPHPLFTFMECFCHLSLRFSSSFSPLVFQSPPPITFSPTSVPLPCFLSLSGEETVAIKHVCWGLGVWRTTVTLCDPALDPRRTNE